MIFRRQQPQQPRVTHERRLRALGVLIDEHGYERDGLCILGIAEGFSVTGLQVPARGANHDLVQHTETFSNEEVEAVAARFRDRE